MEESNTLTPAGRELPRRTIVKGAAWSIPVIAAAIAAPMSAASTVDGITPDTLPTPTGFCSTVSDFTFAVTQSGGAPAVGQSVIVTLPADFTWSDNGTGSRTLTTDSNGIVTITGVKASSVPGTYSVLAQVSPNGASTSVSVTVTGIWVGTTSGYPGSSMYEIYTSGVTDPQNPGTPDNWAYCLEHAVTPRGHRGAYTGDLSSYLGSNLFTDPTVQAKVLWVLAHGYPALSLADFGAAAGAPNISRNAAIEAMQYAIWRYTDVGQDVPWDFNNDADEAAAYWYLVNGANASNGSGGTGTVVSVPNTECGTPTPGDHAQSFILAI